MLRHIAVIDIGKTNAKLVLFDASSAHEVETLSIANEVQPGPPYPHYDLDRLWQFMLSGLKKLNAAHGVDAISITTHGATAVLMSEDTIALPVLDYEYYGPEKTRRDYRKVRSGFSETFSPGLPDGLNLAAQLFSQNQFMPDDFARVTDILMYPQYWAFRLTGIKASEKTSLGVHTGLWAPAKDDFSGFVDTMGWRRLFPPMQPARAELGSISESVAELTGLDPKTPVATGIHDSNASLLPYLLAVKGRFSVVSSGTWTIIMSPGATTDLLDERRDCLANVDAFGRPVPTARFMGGREFAILMEGVAATSVEADDIAHVIDNDVMVLPGFAGPVGPFPNQQGHWTNGPDGLTPAQKLAAVSLYLALMTRTCLSLAGLGDEVMLEGPLAGNSLYARALSALVGKPVRPSQEGTGTALGAAMLFDAVPTSVIRLSEPVAPLDHPGLDAYAARWKERVGD